MYYIRRYTKIKLNEYHAGTYIIIVVGLLLNYGINYYF